VNVRPRTSLAYPFDIANARKDHDMADSVHGLEVLVMVEALARPVSRAELLGLIAARYGAQAVFHTCAADGLDAGQLLDFLEDHGKLAPGPAGYALRGRALCERA
jgi:probable metal-binding protein